LLAVEKPLSAHWFLEAHRLAHDDIFVEPGWRHSSFLKSFNAHSDGARGRSAHLFDLVRATAIF
jgi:hypothetical protein